MSSSRRLNSFGDANERRLQLASFVSAFDRFAMPPMLVAIAHDLNVPLSQIVGAAGAYFLIYGLMQPIWGMLSNRLGLAATITWCTLAGSIATLSATWIGGVLMLTIARAVAGGLFSATVPAALIYIGDTAPPHRRQRDVTNLMTGVALGMAISTTVAGALTYFVGWRWVFAVSGCVGIISSLYIARLTELPRVSFRQPLILPLMTVLKTRAVQHLLLLAMLDGAAILGALTFIPTAVESTGQNAAISAGVTAIYGVAVLAGARIVGRLSHGVSASVFILAGSAVGAVACVLLALSIEAVAAGIACVLLGIAWASMHSSLQTWATEVMPKDRSIAVSFFAGSLFAGSAIAAALGGPLVQRQEFMPLFASAALILVIVGVTGYIARAHWEHHQ